MKFIIWGIIVFLVVSCATPDSNKEKLVEHYAESRGGTRAPAAHIEMKPHLKVFLVTILRKTRSIMTLGISKQNITDFIPCIPWVSELQE